MKKNFLTFLFLTFIGFFASPNLVKAQDGEGTNLRIGAFAGVGFNSLNSNVSGVDYKGKMGGRYGVVVDYFFAPRYAFSTGITMQHGGGKIDGLPDSLALKLAYLQIPLNLKLRTSDFGQFIPFFQLGVSPAFAVTKKVGDTKAEDVNSLNVLLNVGAGTEFKISESTNAFASLFYDYGFLNLAKDAPNDFKLKKSTFGLTVGVFF